MLEITSFLFLSFHSTIFFLEGIAFDRCAPEVRKSERWEKSTSSQKYKQLIRWANQLCKKNEHVKGSDSPKIVGDAGIGAVINQEHQEGNQASKTSDSGSISSPVDSDESDHIKCCSPGKRRREHERSDLAKYERTYCWLEEASGPDRCSDEIGSWDRGQPEADRSPYSAATFHAAHLNAAPHPSPSAAACPVHSTALCRQPPPLAGSVASYRDVCLGFGGGEGTGGLSSFQSRPGWSWEVQCNWVSFSRKNPC
jgi:hypothetical protein